VISPHAVVLLLLTFYNLRENTNGQYTKITEDLGHMRFYVRTTIYQQTKKLQVLDSDLHLCYSNLHEQ